MIVPRFKRSSTSKPHLLEHHRDHTADFYLSRLNMEEDEEDDLYGTDRRAAGDGHSKANAPKAQDVSSGSAAVEEESGEEIEEDESDSVNSLADGMGFAF